jgi:hypothetical protein
MALQKFKYWFSILIMIELVSCEEDVKNVRLPEFEQKLVVTSFISPVDTISYVNVSSNIRIYGLLNRYETTGNLTAYISDDTREISLDTSGSGFKFRRKDMAIEEGKTYKLRVISDKGLAAEASCTVPFYRNLKIEADTFRKYYNYQNGYTYSSFMINIFFTDFPDEDNYYRLFCKHEVYTSSQHNVQYYMIPSGFTNEFFSDKGKNSERSLVSSIALYDIKNADSSFIRIYLFNTDKPYFDYHMSLKNYSGGEDPFTEASPVYSNVIGGLGIFAAYNVDSLVFRLK